MESKINSFEKIVQIARLIHGRCYAVFILYMLYQYRRVLRRSIKYKLKTVPDTFILTIGLDSVWDPNNTVIVYCTNVLIQDKVLLLHQGNKFRHVYVLPSSLWPVNETKDIILVPDTLYHNLSEFQLNEDFELRECTCTNVIYSDEVVVSLINCPTEINNATIDSLLQNYFSLPKIVYNSDIITINVRQFGEKEFYLNRKINSVENVHFKCTTKGGFCLFGKTAIKQSANIQNFIPKKSDIYLIDTKNRIKIHQLYPNGFDEHFLELERAVKPFFVTKNRLKLNPVFLIHGERGSGKKMLIFTLAAKFGVHFYDIHNSELTANVYAQNETKLRNIFFTAKMSAPCFMYLSNFEHFSKNNEGQYDERIISNFLDEMNILFDKNKYPIVVFCSANTKTVAAGLNRIFLQTFDIKAPNDLERTKILQWICGTRDVFTDDLSQIANKTHGFLFEDLQTLVSYALLNKNNCSSSFLDELSTAIDKMQANYNESLGAPKIPQVQWSDVGGLNDVKNEIIKTIEHPNLLEKVGLKRTGILLFGPPGTGKTLIAKAVATECKLCFLSVKGPELLNMYVGQSEQNVRDVFEKARQASPCIIFFDELDSLAPNRGMNGDSGGVMDRVVSQLLAEMDGLNKSGQIFIIGATNRPDLIDPALLRPGRFDKLLYVGPCTDFNSKVSVLQALTRKFRLSEDAVLEQIVKDCPTNVTGADFYGICSNAWMRAVQRLINSGADKDLTAKDVVVGLEDFKHAIKNVKPSVTSEDLQYFEKLKKELASNV